eukprot:15450740-Alexandrium_andersonii.AAC.1
MPSYTVSSSLLGKVPSGSDTLDGLELMWMGRMHFRHAYRPSSRVSRVSGPDPSSPHLPRAPRSSVELLGALRSSAILENAKLLEAFEA